MQKSQKWILGGSLIVLFLFILGVISNLTTNEQPQVANSDSQNPQETSNFDFAVLPGWESATTLERTGDECDPVTRKLIESFPTYIINFERIDRAKDIYFWVYKDAETGQPVRKVWSQYLARERHLDKMSHLTILVEEYKTSDEAKHRTSSPQLKPGDPFPTQYDEWQWLIGGGSREFPDERTIYYDAGHLLDTWSVWFASGTKGVYRIQVGVLCVGDYALDKDYGKFNASNAYVEVWKSLP